MKIIDGKIKCKNECEQHAIEAILFPETFAYEYLCKKSKKYYKKLLTNPELCDIITSHKRKEVNKMSVENKTVIIVGMTQEDFTDNFPYPNDDIIQDFTDDFFIDSDSWCGGQIFFAHYIDELMEGEWHALDEILDARQRLVAIKQYRENMKKYGYDIPEYLIKFFIVSQVF